MPILLSLVYHPKKNMIISPIELCNPSVADSEGAAPSLQFPPPLPMKNTNLGFCMLQNAPFQALDFDIFSGGAWPRTPVKHIRGWLPAVVCKQNYSKKLASFAESITAHPSEISAKCLLYAQSLCLCVCLLQANVLIRGVVALDIRWVVPNC